MALEDDLRRIAEAAVGRAGTDEELAAIIPTEPRPGERSYLCAYTGGRGATAWLVLDDGGDVVEIRDRIRDVVSIAALCELAEEVAGGGDLDDLRARLGQLREHENPPGIDEAEAAVDALQDTIDAAPRLATPEHLDAVGAATRRLEQALGDGTASPFAEAMKGAREAVERLHGDVEANYKRELR